MALLESHSMFPSYLSQRFLAGPTADTAPSSLRKSLVKLNRLTQGEMARIRVDWRTFGPVDAGRPFYPLFKDEYPSAYQHYTTTASSLNPSLPQDTFVVPSNDPDLVVVTSCAINSIRDQNPDFLGDVLALISALRAQGLAPLNHIADLRLESTNLRIGVVLQRQPQAVVDGWTGDVSEWIEGLVKALACCGECGGVEYVAGKGDVDEHEVDNGWSYV